LVRVRAWLGLGSGVRLGVGYLVRVRVSVEGWG
jgi:hypothetical protein